MKIGTATLNARFGKNRDFLPWDGLPKELRARIRCILHTPTYLYIQASGRNGASYLYLLLMQPWPHHLLEAFLNY